MLIELLLLARREDIDPERLLQDVLQLAAVEGGDTAVFLEAARLMKKHQANVLDSLHAAFCDRDDRIISSDRVFDRLGVKRIPLEQVRGCAPAGVEGKGAL